MADNDLISRSALIAYVKGLPTYEPTDRGFIFKRYPSGLFAPDDIVKSIQNSPAVDAMEVVRLIDYIDKAVVERPHSQTRWIDEQGNAIPADVGYAEEWWGDCMKPELLRVFGKQGD